MNAKISTTLINDLLYYTCRSYRFDTNIVDVTSADKSDIGYSDIYDEYCDDLEFNYYYEAAYTSGAATAYANAFEEYIKALFDVSKSEWRTLVNVDSEKHNVTITVYAENGSIMDIFDYSKPEDRAILTENTIYEIEKYLAGPDLTDDEE